MYIMPTGRRPGHYGLDTSGPIFPTAGESGENVDCSAIEESTALEIGW